MGDFNYYGIDVPLDVAFKDTLCHYGTPQNGGRPGSGRYEEGSGKRPYQHGGGPPRSNTNRKSLDTILAMPIGFHIASATIVTACVAALIACAVYPEKTTEIVENILERYYKKASSVREKIEKNRIVQKHLKDWRSKDSTYDKQRKTFKLSKPESLDDTIRKSNSSVNNITGGNNCWSCSIAACLRRMGYDVRALSSIDGATPSEYGRNTSKYYTRNLKWVKLPGTGKDYQSSNIQKVTSQIKAMIGSDKYGVGIIGLDWKDGGGHAFNWEYVDGNVNFFDTQSRSATSGGNKEVSNYFSLVNSKYPIEISRVDNSQIWWDRLDKVVER